jgi:hypothetical protein
MIDCYFRDWLLDFIPKEDDPQSCDILDVSLSYRSCIFVYINPNGVKKSKELVLELY